MLSDGLYFIFTQWDIRHFTSLVLEPDIAAANAIKQQPYTGLPEQKWLLTSHGAPPGVFGIKHNLLDLDLDAPAVGFPLGAGRWPVQLFPSHSGTNQDWLFERFDDFPIGVNAWGEVPPGESHEGTGASVSIAGPPEPFRVTNVWASKALDVPAPMLGVPGVEIGIYSPVHQGATQRFIFIPA